jgi:hypothetical protein
MAEVIGIKICEISRITLMPLLSQIKEKDFTTHFLPSSSARPMRIPSGPRM